MKVYQIPPVRPIQRKPIQYWQAKQGSHVLAQNNSIALRRYYLRGVKGVTFHTIR